MTDLSKLDGYAEAARVMHANRTPRYCELDLYERVADTTQYEGRADWFVAGKGVPPLMERKPCVTYDIVAQAIESNCDLVLGEGRFGGVVLSREDESEAESDETKEAESASEKFLRKLQKRTRFRARAGEALEAAQKCGTAVSIAGIRHGKLFIDSTRAKWCEPTFDPQTGAVTSLEIRYPYLQRVKLQGKWTVHVKLYRRVIDTEKDVTYLPNDARSDGEDPGGWRADKNQVFPHNFGFCPVRWYAFMAKADTVARIDGHPIHERCIDKCQALDFALSQRHRAALQAGDPQWIEIGVSDDDGPEATGRHADPLATRLGGPASDDNPVTGRYVERGNTQQTARKKGPGEVWRYDNPEAKVSMVTLPGDALKAIDDHQRDLRSKVAESLRVVFLDPESVKYANMMSGKAIEALMGRQTDRCLKIREDFEEGWLIPVVEMLLAILRTLGGAAEKLVKGAMAGLAELGTEPELEASWGQFFANTPTDEQAIVDVVTKAAPHVTQRRILEKLAPVFGYTAISQEMMELEREREEKFERDLEQQQAANHGLAQIANGLTQGTGSGAPQRPKAQTSGGSSPTSSPAPGGNNPRNRRSRRR